jgi:hypothetical protein
MTRIVDIRSGTTTDSPAPAAPAAAVATDDPAVPSLPQIGAEYGLVPTTYHEVADKRFKLEWTREGLDYIYQWRPLQASPLDEREIIARLINVLADYVPRDIDVNIDIPVPDMQILFYTIRVNKVAERPGAERMCEEKILAALCAIDVWTPAIAPA